MVSPVPVHASSSPSVKIVWRIQSVCFTRSPDISGLCFYGACVKNRSTTTLWQTHGTRVLVGLMVLVAAVCVVVVVQIRGLENKPRWWDQAWDVQDAEQAVQIENAISTQLTALRPIDAQQWSVALTPGEINTWLAHRLRATVETHAGEGAWPNGLDAIRVAIDGDKLIIGALVHHDSGSSYIWSRCRLEVNDGILRVSIDTPRVGTTRMPMRVVRSVFSGSLSKEFRAYIDLEDGRIARLVALRIHEGRIEFVNETVPDSDL